MSKMTFVFFILLFYFEQMWSWPVFACFLHFLVPEAACQVKMVLIYGSVTSDATGISTTFSTVEDCKNGCFGSESCIIAYFSLTTCVFYNYVNDGKTITVEENSNNAYVAIKVSFTIFRFFFLILYTLT